MPALIRLVFALLAISGLAAFPSHARAQEPPARFRVRSGVCPFECCTYREWTAHSDIPVYKEPRDTNTILFRLRPQERFQGLTGNVYIDRFGMVEVLRRTPAIPGVDERTWFEPGQQIYLLDYRGEGFQNVLWKDSVIEVEVFWRAPEDTVGVPPTRYQGILRVSALETSWARVRNAAGLEGWIQMTDFIGGVDACSM